MVAGMILFYDSKTRAVSDDHGSAVDIETARRHWTDGRVDDCNLSFLRLVYNDFDPEALERSRA